jgi:hypothetical protein
VAFWALLWSFLALGEEGLLAGVAEELGLTLRRALLVRQPVDQLLGLRGAKLSVTESVNSAAPARHSTLRARTL